MFGQYEVYLNYLVYFFNVTNSYFLISGFFTIILLFYINKKRPKIKELIEMFIYAAFITIFFNIAEFFPYFLLGTPFFVYFLWKSKSLVWSDTKKIILFNIIFFYVSQFLLYSVPYIIIVRDLIVPLKVIWNSLWTLSPTTSSAVISIYFSVLFSIFVYFRPKPTKNKYATLLILSIVIASYLTYANLPKTEHSEPFLPPLKGKLAERVVFLNIHGCRFDRFDTAELPTIQEMKDNGVYFKRGATSVYPALTEPSLTSILTGMPPEKHGIKNNNFRGGIKWDALPDVVETIGYGNIHFEDVRKPDWNIKVISLPSYGFKNEDMIFDMLKSDIMNSSARLFYVDLSNVDITGHSYGSGSTNYVDALIETDKRIGKFLDFLDENNLLDSTVVIVSAEHGQAGMDHGYYLKASEKYVPMVYYGGPIKKGIEFEYNPSTMDLNPTITYVLGVNYTKNTEARVLLDIFEA